MGAPAVVVVVLVVGAPVVVVPPSPSWNSSSAPIEIEWAVNVDGVTWAVICVPGPPDAAARGPVSPPLTGAQ